MERADIYQIAKNCRTSVGMIEKYYAVHFNIFTRRRCHQCHPLEKRPVGGKKKHERNDPLSAAVLCCNSVSLWTHKRRISRGRVPGEGPWT